MKRYTRPEFHLVANPGGMSGNQLAALTDAEFAAYLKKIRFQEEKKRYQISPDFMLREIAGEYAIVPVGASSTFGNAMLMPNKTAAFLWNAFSTPSTKEDAVMQALKRFESEEESIRRDVEQFIKESLDKRALLEVE